MLCIGPLAVSVPGNYPARLITLIVPFAGDRVAYVASLALNLGRAAADISETEYDAPVDEIE